MHLMYCISFYRKQPDKSIDLIDEACSRLRLEQESKPEIIWKVERDLLTRQIELSALDNEMMDDDESQRDHEKFAARRAECEEEVERLTAEVKRLTDMWMAEKNALNRVQQVKEEMEQARTELETARRQGNYTRAGELMHSTIPKLERDLETLEHVNDEKVDNGKKQKGRHKNMLASAVTADAIAAIIARHTGIPVSRIAGGGSESRKLLAMEDKLRERVVGQDHALSAVSNCVRLSRTRLHDSNRTLGNFLFLGPTVS
jgi:ATP-dependent Clp protease ATP-binding subunit ClpB